MNPAVKRALGLGAVAALGYGIYSSSTQRSQVQTASARSPPTPPSPPASASSKPLAAICVLQQENGSGVSGIVNFRQANAQAPVEITARVTGLKDGKHGFHVHEFGNLTKGCTTAGGHYNPFNRTHGDLRDEERHVGDMGNVVSAKGVAEYKAVDELRLLQLSGETSIIGRAVVVHADPDDLGKGGFDDSKTVGHAGARLACGVIGADKP